ncbi:hypothetical protein COHA_003372, partial [Chlorella ohadii]
SSVPGLAAMTAQQAPPEKGADGSSQPSDAAGAGAQRSMSGGPPRSFNRQTTVPRKPLDVEKLGDDPDILELRQSFDPQQLAVLSRLRSCDHSFAKKALPTRNPLLRAWQWWCAYLLPGMGMFSEAYFIFAIGNIEPLFEVQMPNCWACSEGTACTCNQTTVDNVQNIEISAIIVGMLSFGFVADVIGRKWGSRLTMIIMFIGACLLTGAYGPTDQVFLSVFCFSLFFYAVGVGGEYPLAASSAAERAEGDPELRKRRGEMVVLTFSQQGWGNFTNTLVILLLLAMQGATGPLTSREAELTWRLQFGVGAFICFCVTVYRWLYLEESEVWKAEHEGVQQELVDEGDKAALAGKRSWREHWVIFKWTLLNSGVSLVGYYFAAYTIDRKWMGRKRLQSMGFLMMFILYLPCGIWYNELVDHAIKWFQTLYFLSSFFNQFGPNCTSFLVAGEVFPTDVRAFFHGISAAAGKLGAILAASIFSQVDTATTFYCSAGAGIVGAVFTWIFLPDTTGLDLAEIDRYHRFMLAGQTENYHGPAVKPKHLSMYERWRGYGKHYDARLDAQQRKLQDMAAEREEWEHPPSKASED